MSRGAPTPDERLLIAEIDLGLATEQFVKSDVGRYLIGRARGEAEEAIERLKKVDANDPKSIREIQNEIWRAESFQQWLEDTILGGRNAEEQFVHGAEQQPGD